MVGYLLMWLVISVIAVLAFAFGSAVGYRRGHDEAQTQPRAPSALRPSMSTATREVRLPKDVHLGR